MKISALVQTLMLGAALALPASALAQEEISTDLCKVDEVATYPNRVHVRCSNTSFPRYFASPTSSSSEATRLVTLGTASFNGPGWLQIVSNVFSGGADSFGCGSQDCRRPIEIRLIK